MPKDERYPFDVIKSLEHIRHSLPAQGPIKDFVHHNTLHAFQHLPFAKAVEEAAVFYGAHSYMPLSFYRRLFSQGKIAQAQLDIAIGSSDSMREHLFSWIEPKDDMGARENESDDQSFRRQLYASRAIINPLLFRLVSAYLDQGIGLWSIPHTNLSFFECVGQLVKNSWLPLASFVSRKRVLKWFELSPEIVVYQLLQKLVGDESKYDSYLTAILMLHPGWSGMVATTEEKPLSLTQKRQIRLLDFVAIRLILQSESEFSSSSYLATPPAVKENKLKSQLSAIWQDAFERTYYHKVLQALYLHNKSKSAVKPNEKKTVQMAFCIDDRECSFRRWIEETDPTIETFGLAGFFGLDIRFQSLNDAYPVQSCPVNIDPKYTVREVPAPGQDELFARQKANNEKEAKSSTDQHSYFISVLWGWIASYTLGHLSGLKLILSILRPTQLAPSLFIKKINIATELTYDFTVDDMANKVFNVLRGIGLTNNFSELVVFIAHGSSSVNNPHFSAYDCGACSGKPGAPNARAFATFANMPEVRKLVAEKGIVIPPHTQFVGGYHDTCSDSVIFFDCEKLSEHHAKILDNLQKTLNIARELNAKERCRRFAVVDLDISPQEALAEVLKRSTALFEPRPELGHATNTICVVARRSLTRGLFLDRRAFMNSYDPDADPAGLVLNQILSAVVPVCGGITLEYYFSRVDNRIYGCGTKLSHNVCGLLGVMNGIDDDLRTGLPEQMIEIHDPLRLLIVVEQSPDIILQVIQNNSAIAEWIDNDWVKIACLDPKNGLVSFYQPTKGFCPYPLKDEILPTVPSSSEWAQTSRENLAIVEIIKSER